MVAGRGRIVYTRWPGAAPRPNQKSSIHAALPDGSNSRMISAKRTSLDFELDHSPDISPDGSRVVYSTTRHKVDGDYARWRSFEIETVGLDGKERLRLTDSPSQEVWPKWSPDGKHIAFARTVPGGDPEGEGIFVMNADGSNLRQLFPFYRYE